MTLKDTFYKEMENFNKAPTHIADTIPESLNYIDELYGVADVLSVDNAIKHQQILLLLSVIGTLTTIAFLLYDEAELYGLIFACIILIIFLIIIRQVSEKNNYHKKYLEYRVLAETLRVQYYLYFAGINKQITDIMPWYTKKSIPWIIDVLNSIPTVQSDMNESILDCWIINQKNYHESALKKNTIKKRRNDNITKIVIIITIIAYIFALAFEIYMYTQAPQNIDVNTIRAVIKIVLGTMSAITLFTGNYYGKMSLDNIISDHERMKELYEKAEKDISEKEENKELLIYLAREFLIENGTWYAYQSKNKVDLVI